MGLLTAIGAGLTNVGSFLGSTIESFATSPLGSTFLGQVGQYGVQQLGSLIGITPTRVSGAPAGYQTGPTAAPPIGTMGPGPIGPLGRPMTHYPASEVDIQYAQSYLDRAFATGDQAVIQRAANQLLSLMPTTIPFLHVPTAAGGPTRPPSQLAPPSVPWPVDASQPIGGQPVAFPVTRQASFPAPSFLPALFGGSGAPVQQASALGSIARQLPGLAAGLGVGELIESFGGNGGGTPMFRPTMAGARAQFFRTQNPVTGQDTWFRPAGRPLLWSGDLTACKRVNKIARRARRKR